jgi:hypothetical protein
MCLFLCLGNSYSIRSDAERIDKQLNTIELLEEMRYFKAKMLNSNYNLNYTWLDLQCIVHSNYTL